MNLPSAILTYLHNVFMLRKSTNSMEHNMMIYSTYY